MLLLGNRKQKDRVNQSFYLTFIYSGWRNEAFLSNTSNLLVVAEQLQSWFVPYWANTLKYLEVRCLAQREQNQCCTSMLLLLMVNTVFISSSLFLAFNDASKVSVTLSLTSEIIIHETDVRNKENRAVYFKYLEVS